MNRVGGSVGASVCGRQGECHGDSAVDKDYCNKDVPSHKSETENTARPESDANILGTTETEDNNRMQNNTMTGQ